VGKKPVRFEREKPQLKPLPRVLILCEDSKSCLDYLNEAAQHFRSHAEVEIAHCGKTNPKGIVAEALRRCAFFQRVYCVIDRDTHYGFDEAISAAAAHSKPVGIIASYPCYEFWLLLHFRDTRAPHMSAGKTSGSDRLIKELVKEQGMERYAKGCFDCLFLLLLDKLPDAPKTRREGPLAGTRGSRHESKHPDARAD
jgi:hypothetical protein